MEKNDLSGLNTINSPNCVYYTLHLVPVLHVLLRIINFIIFVIVPVSVLCVERASPIILLYLCQKSVVYL